MYEMPWHTQTQLMWLCAVAHRHNFYQKGEKNTSRAPHSYVVAASSSSCAQVSSTSVGFTSWLTVSITITGMIGSFKSVLKSLGSYLLLPPPPGSFWAITVTAQWNVEMCCIGLFLHVYCFFLDLWLKSPLLYFEWSIHMNEDLCL